VIDMVTRLVHSPKTNNLSSGYVRAVRRLGSFLSETKDLFAQHELPWAGAGNEAHPLRTVPEGEQSGITPVGAQPARLSRSVTEPLARELGDRLGEFELQARAIGDEGLHAAFAQAELHPYLLDSPFAARTYTKPLGYAGDYEMVNMMLGESESAANGAFARLVDDVLTNVPVAHAHKNRISILERALIEEATSVNAAGRMCSILSMGCGPAMEIQHLLRRRELGGSILHLVDFNEQTIEYLGSRMNGSLAGPSNRPILKFFCQSLEEIATNDASDPRRKTYDVVYCTGLFDYFADDMCRELVRRYLTWLRPGGVLITSNVHPSNPHRQCMEHLVEWFLVYRDEAQMRALAPPAHSPRIFTDNTGLNVFSSIRT
jgi:extracellular factor (EF) 3-hydroxypalmitic acid methyl ester biosynthesis protein